jgi:formamidopyrimidine-DNA glycosylase
VPELPDLLYMKKILDRTVRGRAVREVEVQQPVVLRNAIDRPLGECISGNVILEIGVRGPFLRLGLSERTEVIINLMLAGRLQHQRVGERREGYACISFTLDDETRLNVCDARKMTKVYVVRAGEFTDIPKYAMQGIDILSPGFSPAASACVHQ